MSPIKTIAFLYPGGMGASLARLLHLRQPDLTLLTSLAGRSASTGSRAAEAGLVDVPFTNVVRDADIIFSILPPSSALSLAEDVAGELKKTKRSPPPIYIDANAISPGTMRKMAGILGDDVPLIDGSVIGFPANDTSEPKIFLAADPRWAQELKVAEHALRGTQGGHGLESPDGGLHVVALEDGGAGAASALKMCYAGMAKGYIGLASLLVLSAHAHSPGTAKALMTEMASSVPDKLHGLGFSFQDMPSKAYRWVGEMEEISSFIEDTLKPAGPEGSAKPSGVYDSLASVFERVAADLRATGKAEGAAAEGPKGQAEEIATLLKFGREGRELVEKHRRDT